MSWEKRQNLMKLFIHHPQSNKPDVVLLTLKKTMSIIEFSAPTETNGARKKDDRRKKYQDLFELCRLFPDYTVRFMILIIRSEKYAALVIKIKSRMPNWDTPLGWKIAVFWHHTATRDTRELALIACPIMWGVVNGKLMHSGESELELHHSFFDWI